MAVAGGPFFLFRLDELAAGAQPSLVSPPYPNLLPPQQSVDAAAALRPFHRLLWRGRDQSRNFKACAGEPIRPVGRNCESLDCSGGTSSLIYRPLGESALARFSRRGRLPALPSAAPRHCWPPLHSGSFNGISIMHGCF